MRLFTWFTKLLVWVFLLSQFCANNPVELSTTFANMAIRSHNSSRCAHVSEVLAQAAGVYSDKRKGEAMGLSKTIFMSMAAFNQKNIAHYKVYFRNFLCFIHHYDIDMVLYVLHHDKQQLAEETTQIQNMGVRVLSFPEELFWQVLSTKKSVLKVGKGYADYQGDTPSFAAHGALVMLIPVLEALELGYNVVFFDVDIGLVQDPIPYLTRGNADFVSSLEVRHCAEFFSTSRPNLVDWQTIEPNTGVMHVRSTVGGKQLFRSWWSASWTRTLPTTSAHSTEKHSVSCTLTHA